MSDNNKLSHFFDSHLPGLFSVIISFLVIETIIFLACLAYTSDRDVVKIYNSDNQIIYEDRYNLNKISEFKRLYGIRSFQKEGYTIKRFEIQNPFPTRAWIALSVCVPMVLVMFIVFLIKVFSDIFQLRKKAEETGGKSGGSAEADKKTSDFEETRFERLFSTLERMNIYSLGFAVIMAVFLYWVIPDLLIYVSKVSYQTVSELKWVFLGLVVFVGIILVAKLVISYKTRTEIIRQQADIQKHRDRLAIEQKIEMETRQLEHFSKEKDNRFDA